MTFNSQEYNSQEYNSQDSGTAFLLTAKQQLCNAFTILVSATGATAIIVVVLLLLLCMIGVLQSFVISFELMLSQKIFCDRYFLERN